MRFKNSGNIKELNVRVNDKKLINVSELFINDIEKNFIAFQGEYIKNKKKLQKYLSLFQPEKLAKQSPLTIINGPWGSGKTFFIENLLALFFDGKIKSDVFRKMIIIDAWKFSHSKDVVFEFAEELGKRLIAANGLKVNKKQKEGLISRLINAITPSSISFSLNVAAMGSVTFRKNIDEKNTKDKTIKTKWKKISENKEPIIIFIDNLERLGSLSWDLLKTILKLQELPNYLIVLPMNVRKIKNNEHDKLGEYPIEKYIDFNLYDFKQDYSNFFETHYKDVKLLKNLNMIFSEEIDGENLSIREVEQSFKANNLFAESEPYLIFKKVRDKIWNAEKSFEQIFESDLKTFLDIEKQKAEVFRSIVEKMMNKKNGEYVNVLKSDQSEGGKIFHWKIQKRTFYDLNYDYLPEFNELKAKVENRGKSLDSDNDRIEKETKTAHAAIARNKKSQLERIKEIANLEKKIKQAEQENENFDSKNIAQLKSQLKIVETKNAKLGKTIIENKQKIEGLSRTKKENTILINELFLNITKEIQGWSKIVQSNPLSDLTNKKMTLVVRKITPEDTQQNSFEFKTVQLIESQVKRTPNWFNELLS